MAPLEKSKRLSTNMRYVILAFVFINIVINYMDRTNVSIAMPELSKEIGLSTVQQGLIFSAFGWIYAAMQIPGGILLDKFGSRIMYFISLFGWSLVTVFQAFISGFGQLMGLRLGVGFFEAPVMPANNRAISYWFPEDERGTAIGIYSSAQFLGLAFSTPILYEIHNSIGWRGLFVVTGVVGIIWSIIWYIFYSDPDKSRFVGQAELKYIKAGGAITDDDLKNVDKHKVKLNSQNIKQLFSRRLIGIYIGQFAISGTFWFFLTWFPTYLTKAKHVNFLQSGFLSSIPYLAAFCGVILAGFISDQLIKKGRSASLARKAPVITGLLLTLLILGANFVSSPALIILFMSIAFFGNGLATITWVFVTALAPKHLIGLAGGIFNGCGALSSIVIPIVIGILVSNDNFSSALVFIAAIALLGALSYIFVVGKIELKD
ncbi:MFS transporter [Pediococcus acidilactici]|uniref:MFS transporter n=1 Tax=Pediococcus acidilactici TaxID=1254 RepID=UPI00232BB306|nr:MFS transporter [Pediococcus acidilactici]MDB8859892.1 MFS transporter [Pediococcus acidilactici]MDB8861170.1 MFS transporter [Pediococcus acidilactici]MDB8863370.1 MFS transporter [Pediococcus acidilactici]MDB8866061.1 MFS transporter [Pediococcus acidilactici]